MRIEADTKLAYRDVLIKPKRSTLKSRSEVSLTRTYRFRHAKRTWTGVPVMAANMDSVATFEMAEALATHECFTCIHKHYSIEEWTTWAGSDSAQAALPFTAVSCGTSEADFAKVKEVVGKTKVRFVCADVANGYSEHFVEFIKRARADLPEDVVIIAGNVCSPEMTEELVLAGADIVKIGIGPGSACKTRSMTGVGYPQLSAVIECADAAHGLDGLVIADGGCTCPGDVAKAFGGGADFVMLGGMLAGHDECGGEVGVDEATGEKFKVFYGMSSTTAQKKYAGGVAGYRASEGKTVRVPYRGPVLGTMLDVLGGLRSTCTYVGAPHLKELSKRTTFVRCTIQLNEVFSSAKHRADAGTGMKRLPEAAGDGADAKRAKK